MGRHAATTVIFAGTRRVARVDLGVSHQAPVLAWQAPRTAEQTLEDCVETAIAAQARCGRSVWILSEDLWTQALELPAVAVAGLTAAEIERALGFELESLSGFEASHSQCAFCRNAEQDGMVTFWVTQVPSGLRDQLHRMVRSAGGRLSGLAHPAGMPGSCREQATGAVWRRLELWNDTTVGVDCDGYGTVRSRAINGSPDQQSWRQHVNEWDQSSGSGFLEIMGAGTETFPPVFSETTEIGFLPELEGDLLDRWLRGWGRALAQGQETGPVVRPEPPTMSSAGRAGVALVVAAVIGAACFAHGHWFGQRVENAQVEVEKAEAPSRQLASLRKEAEKLQAQIDEAMKHAGSPTGPPPLEVLAIQRKRVAALLDALGQFSDSDRTLTELTCDGRGTITIHGLGLTPETADRLAVSLGRALTASGWLLHGAEKTAMKSFNDGGPWEFRITLDQAPIVRPSARAVTDDALSLVGGGA